MKKVLCGLLILILIFSFWGCGSPEPPEDVAPAIDAEALDTALDNVIVRDDGLGLAGLAVAAVKDGEVVYTYANGYSRIDNESPENNLPFTADTRVRIASVSKTFTSIGIMQLVEEGLIDLDEDISTYLGFELRNPSYPDTAITSRMLLSHTSSLRDGELYSIAPEYSVSEFFTADGAFYEDGAHFAPEGQAPDEYFSYANINFGLLGTIIESVTDQRFDIYMTENVLSPMGIKASYNVSDFDTSEVANLSPVYRKQYDENGLSQPGSPWIAQVDDYQGTPVAANTTMISNPDSGSGFEFVGLEGYVPGRNATHFSPQGGLRISANELVQLPLMFMNDGISGENQILSKESVDLMFTPQWTWNGDDGDGTNGDFEYGLFACWGLGIHIITNGEHYDGYGDTFLENRPLNLAGHYGDAYGMFSIFMVDRDADQAFVYLTNGAECDVYGEPCWGNYSENWCWEEDIVTALYQYIFPE